MYRSPKTTQERRETQCRGFLMEVDGYQVKVRACRNDSGLPNAWDDEPRACYQRTWKSHRKTQWKLNTAYKHCELFNRLNGQNRETR